MSAFVMLFLLGPLYAFPEVKFTGLRMLLKKDQAHRRGMLLRLHAKQTGTEKTCTVYTVSSSPHLWRGVFHCDCITVSWVYVKKC